MFQAGSEAGTDGTNSQTLGGTKKGKKGKPTKEPPPTRPVYPRGRDLPPHEKAEARKNAPMDSTGKKQKCWWNTTWAGCRLGHGPTGGPGGTPGKCPHSSEEITTLNGLRWTLKCIPIRCGGLK